jgi:hypothetical protein
VDLFENRWSFSVNSADMLPSIPVAVDIPGMGLAVFGIVLSIGAIYIAIKHGRNLVHVQRQTETLRQEMLNALEIHENVVKDDRLGVSIRHLAQGFAKTLDSGDPLLVRLAHRDLDQLREHIRMGAEGHRAIGEDGFSNAEALASILLEMTEPGDEFWASSLVHGDFWTRADKYLHQQQEKVKAGVAIHRAFVFDSTEARDHPYAQEQMQRQWQADICVNHVVDPDSRYRDLVVVRKKDLNCPSGFREIYAADFVVDPSRRIDAIDIWAASSGQHADRLKDLWWSLQNIFNHAESFVGRPSLSSQPNTIP